MSIQPLSGEVVAQITSSILITSLNSVVCGLLRNSLDAKASRVNISVDYLRGNCSVEDDGQGIPPPEFHRDGGLGKNHNTSKYPPRSECHGRYGTFLASVAALSLLTATSHHHLHNSHNSVCFHNSEVLARNMPALPAQRILAFSHGTRVVVRDLFGSMPVRVKQRALDADRIGNAKDWDQLVSAIVALLLAWPHNLTVNVRDATSSHVLTLRTIAPLGGSCRGEEKSISQVARLLSQASLCDIADIGTWVPIKASTSGIYVHGGVSLIPSASKRIQFINIGIEPILGQAQANELYDEINRIFSNSSFGNTEEDGNGGFQGDQRRADGSTTSAIKSRKGLERWPMFSISITLKAIATQGVDEILDESQSPLAVIIDILRAMFHEFLKKHHFRPQSEQLSSAPYVRRYGSRSLSAYESVQRKWSPKVSLSCDPHPADKGPKLDNHNGRVHSRSQSPFASWTRIKAGQVRNHTPKTGQEDVSFPSIASQDKAPGAILASSREPEARIGSKSLPPLVDASGKLTRRPFGNFIVSENCEKPLDKISRSTQGMPTCNESQSDEAFSWQNPISKVTSVIDSRTGFVIRPRRSLSQLPIRRSKSASATTEVQGPAKEPPENEPSPWVQKLLLSWENPVFELAQPAIPRLGNATEKMGTNAKFERSQCMHNSLDTGDWSGHASFGSHGRISKHALRDAELVAQVDQKFLLVKIPMETPVVTSQHEKLTQSNPNMLVLIDQHAADERCRVEALMQDFFSRHEQTGVQQIWKAVTSKLDKPQQFDLSPQECRLLVRYQSHFKHWGIFYEVIVPPHGPTTHERGPSGRVRVLHLPTSIAERCRLEPRLVADLIRKEVWTLEQSAHLKASGSRVFTHSEEDHRWAAQFHGCPQGIVDLINSRACRSAIMFNDILSREECTALLARLAECAFPFQCAHGRPSTVPLLDLGPGMPTEFLSAEEEEPGFLAKFGRWRRPENI